MTDIGNNTGALSDERRELRSLNAQIEYVLRDALRKSGRLPRHAPPSSEDEA